MKLSAKSHRKLEEFFREHFADENFELPEIQIYCRRGAKYLTGLLAVDGITFGRHIFIKPHRLWRAESNDLWASPSLMAHEIAHTLQYRREGTFKFLYGYVKSYFVALRQMKRRDHAARMEAYRQIPHEVEARRVAAKYVSWRECRKPVYSSSVNSK